MPEWLRILDIRIVIAHRRPLTEDNSKMLALRRRREILSCSDIELTLIGRKRVDVDALRRRSDGRVDRSGSIDLVDA
jgi:hypothetical protein